MKNKYMVKALSAALAIVMAGGNVTTLAPMAVNAATAEVKGEVLETFVDPSENTDAKPMVRFWFPDAGAGLSSEELQELKDAGEDVVVTEEYLQMVSDQIMELYNAGFGGVEMTMLSDGTNYDQEVAEKAGWGTEAWSKVLTQALYTANSLGEDEFKVDITMTAHWPLIIDTVDPNDDQQQQQTASTDQEVTDADLAGDTIELALPEQRHKDTYNTVHLNDSDRCASFLFVSKMVGATVAIQNADGSLVFDSMTSVPTSKVQNADGSYAGYAAGVPGTDYIVKMDGHWQEAQPDNVVTLDADTIVDADGAVLDTATTGTVEVKTMSPWGEQTSLVTHIYDAAGNDITSSATLFTAGTTVYTVDGKYFACEKTKFTDTFGIKYEKTAADGSTYYEDENGRTYMDDWQYIYSVNTADVKAAIAEMPALEDGQKYVLVNAYREGTGYISSGGTTEQTTMNNRTYEIDYYTSTGVQKVIDYWEENMLDVKQTLLDGTETTLREQLENSGVSCIFEDSLELSSSSSFWSPYLVDTEGVSEADQGYEGSWERMLGYKVSDYLPILFGYSVTGDNGMANKISTDKTSLLDDLFYSDHRKVVSDWAKGFGGGYRFQCTSNLSEARGCDVIEADNGTLGNGGEGILQASSTVNVKGDKYLSMEALTSTTQDMDYFQTMMELNFNFSGGINRVILHGTPFKQAVVNELNYWPGWSFADDYWGSGYGAWQSRQPVWDNISTFSDYVTRIQALLQDGSTRVPVLFVGSANMDELKAHGIRYNIAGEDTLMIDEAAPSNVVDGVLNPDGLATQVIVLNGISSVDSVDFVNRLTQYAENGMKIVLYNGTEISSVNGVEATDLPDSNIPADRTNAAVQEAFATLKANENVVSIDTEDDLLAFVEANTDNTIEYNFDGLEATHVTDNSDDTEYYYLWNNYSDGSVAYGNVGVGLDMTNVTGKELETTVTIDKAADENVYQLDAYTGEITELKNYTDNGDGTVDVDIDLAAWDATVLAVSANAAEFEAAGAVKEQTRETGETIDLSDNDWDLTIESYAPTAKNDDPSAPFYQTTVTEMNVGIVKLGLWKDLDLSMEQLNKLGITSEKYAARVNDYFNGGHLIKGNYLGFSVGFGDSMESVLEKAGDDYLNCYISGIGYYTTTVNWDGKSDGAYLYVDHRDSSKTCDAQVNGDMITEVTVTNAKGETTTFKDINYLSNKIDLGDALSKGDNKITIKLTGTLRNRESLEGSLVWRYDLTSTGLTYAAVQGYTVAASDYAEEAEAAKTAAEEALAAAKEALAEAQDAQAAAEAAAAEAKAAKEAADAELKEAQASKDAAAISAAEAKAAAADAAAAKADAAVAEAKAETAEAAAEKANAEAQLAQAKAELAEANAETEKAEAEAAKAEAETAKANSETAKAEAEKAQALAEKAQAAAEAALAKAEKLAASTAKTVAKLAAKKNHSVKVTWKTLKGMTGYVVKYATNKSMKNAKKITVKGTVKYLKGLKKGTKVYVKVRGYKTVAGVKVYSKYSTTKTVTVK